VLLVTPELLELEEIFGLAVELAGLALVILLKVLAAPVVGEVVESPMLVVIALDKVSLLLLSDPINWLV
jgi:hypothetical protein